ncbi:MAG: nucleoside phosphorylase [Bdellovibrionales bacterium]|nr:nucleoside phosphorylase [Bdellovibrionales bacterium]
MNKEANYIEIAGKQYHIGCQKGDLAQKILLVGDPDRAAKVANYFSSVRVQRQHREFHTFTGFYQDQEITVMSTGMGEGCMEISVIEICQLVENPILIRCGSCSALQPNISLGSLIISESAYSLGSLHNYYDIKTQDMISDMAILRALDQACKTQNVTYSVGKTASAPGFYGPQARQIPGFTITQPLLMKDLQDKGFSNLEMEISTLFGLSHLKGIRAGAICAVYGNRALNTFLEDSEIPKAETDCIEASLLALRDCLV